ncbi:MAG: DNA-binding protein [Lachnospiraceae bacterium]|nr:DNA-binding protein [Lachnospiraceae bacterium]
MEEKKRTTAGEKKTALKETAKETAKDTVKKVEKAAAKVEKAVEPAVKKVEEKAAPAAQAVKKETTKAAAKAKTAVKKTAAKAGTAKRGPKKEAEAIVSVQFSGKSYTTQELVAIAKDVWKYDLKQKASDFKSVELYVKPEENQAYYVINGEYTGSFFI